ncbi:histidine kinase [Chitiniphilus shinanonensis]|uniref:Histidine kinase n=1 Tax=Chitiniphilus shinanonensis TaxID=553088 RepID=A0ABQ6C0P3_9NEIS|nr:HDOD domain-containing protein [Chitiniphilus shinanonensis]GLS06067.1 histidine kinase [Chitiniphilus shinanonensis]
MHLEDLFDQTHKLPTIPRIVQELLGTFSQSDINIGEVAKRISLDQVITAKVLRLANSAQFGASRRIGSVNEAIIVLGFDTVRTLVVASGVTGAFVATPGFDRKAFWRVSLRVGSTARRLAAHLGVNPEAAFLCGLLHNIGELLIHVVQPDLAVRIDRSVAGGSNRIALEDQNIGFDYVQVAAELASRWNFPAPIQHALAEQNQPTPEAPLSRLLQLAVLLAAQPEPPSAEQLASGLARLLADHEPALREAIAAEVDELTALDPEMERILS